MPSTFAKPTISCRKAPTSSGRGPHSLTHPATTRSVQAPTPTPGRDRACACGGGCPRCREHAGAGVVPAMVHDVLRSDGRPLEPATRDLMESRFHRDCGRVRVHADALGAESARSLSAQAYTVGSDVVFGRGQYAPATSAGSRLLAHEL